MLIFLDIDGVMVPMKSWERPELMEDGFLPFSSKSVDALKKLITSDTTVLLTTSHKSKYSIQQWKDIFEKRGIQIENLKRLNDNIDNLNRKEELLNWFKNNTTEEEFIIIDDDKSLNDLPAELKSKLILTHPMIGLI